MLRLTRTAIGLLTAQYRSVLRKCWAINVGVFALGAVAATTVLPSEAEAGGGNVATVTEGTSSDYSIKDGAGNYWKVTLNTGNMTSDSSKVTWSKVDASGTNTVTITYKGADDVTKTEYYQYTLASGVSSSARNTNLTGNITGGVYVGTSSSSISEGGALTIASGNTVGGIVSDFIKNYVSVSGLSGNFHQLLGGGAIHNKSSVGSITGDFIGNYANSSSYHGDPYGGAIYNIGTIDRVIGDFIGNYASSAGGTTYGGAIANSSGTINSLIGDFVGNYTNVTSGGPICHSRGGAISNYDKSTIGSITGDFIGNYASAYSAAGGAIYNYISSTIGNITGDFIGNYASGSGSSNIYYAFGGAIYNATSSTIGSITGDFIGNYVSASSSATGTLNAYAFGGAIFNGGGSTISAIIDATIAGNSVTTNGTNAASLKSNGGAIYNQYDTTGNSTITLVAQSSDVNFYNNTVTKGGTTTYNDIYQGLANSTSSPSSSGIINLDAKKGNSISFGGTIDGDSSYVARNILNINQGSANYGGNYNFYNTVQNHTINIGSTSASTREATINLGKILQADGTTTTYGAIKNSAIINNAAARINMQNGYVGANQVNSITSLTLNHNLGFGIDVSLNGTANTADKLGASAITANGNKVIIDSINMTGTTYSDSGVKTDGITKATVNVASSTEKDYVDIASDILSNITGNNYYTKVELEKDGSNNPTGNLIFSDKLINESTLNEALEDISGRSSIQKVIIGSGAVTPDASTGELTPDENKAITLGAAAARGVTTSVATNSADLITSGGVKTFLDNNYYRKNKKSGILNGFEAGKIGNENDDNFSKLAANDNFATNNDNFASNNGDFASNNLSRLGAFSKCEKACSRPSERFPASLEKNSAFEQYSRFARGTFLFVSQTHKNVLDNFYKNSQCLKASNDNFAITTFLRAI